MYSEPCQISEMKFFVTIVGKSFILDVWKCSESASEFCCTSYPTGNYIFKFNNSNTRTMCEICSNLTIKTAERRQWHRSGVFFVKLEHILHLVLVILLLTLSR